VALACLWDRSNASRSAAGGLSRDVVMAISAEGLDELPGHAGVFESPSLPFVGLAAVFGIGRDSQSWLHGY